MSNAAADIFLMSMSILDLAMAVGLMYIIKRKKKQDKQNKRRRGMNRDIAHCDAQYYIFNKHGECEERFCFLKEKCKRYKSHLELKGNEMSPVAWISAYECVHHKHKLYWEDKE